MKILLLLLVLQTALLSKPAQGQVYLEPFAGYQVDLNQGKNKLINSGIQLAFKRKKYEFLVQLQKSWPQQSSKYADSSYTSNPSLPAYAPAIRTIKPSAFSFAVGNRFKLAGAQSSSSLFVKLYTGVMYQKIKVGYQYDKGNYIVLNPDQTQEQTGLFISGGLEYMRQIKNGRLFFELNFSSPPSGHPAYPHNTFMAPVSFNIGYSFKLSKK